MFNSIKEKFKGDQSQTRRVENIQGFICPICMESFKTPELVQKHFDESHPETDDKEINQSKTNVLSPNTIRKESINTLKDNFKDLKQSLDEEMWYNAELKKECERLKKLVDEKDTELEKQSSAIKQYTKQVEESESARDLLAEEIKKFQQSRKLMLEENKTIRSDFEFCEKKLSEMESKEKQWQDTFFQQKSEITSLSEQIVNLKTENLQLNSQITNYSDYRISEELTMEIDKLKQERDDLFNQLRTKSNELSEMANSNGMEKCKFQSEFDKLTEEFRQYRDSIGSKCLSLENETILLNGKLRESNEIVFQLERTNATQKVELDKSRQKVNETESQMDSIRETNKSICQKLKSQETEIHKLQNSATEGREELDIRLFELKTIQEEVDSLKVQLDKERQLKNQLQSQVQMSDAANLVIEQLQSENLSLQNSINNLNKQIQELTEQSATKILTLKNELQIVKDDVYQTKLLLSDKEEALQETEKGFGQTKIDCEKFQKQIDEETSVRSDLEDKLAIVYRELNSKDDQLKSRTLSYDNLKIENDALNKKYESETQSLHKDLENIKIMYEKVKQQADQVLQLNTEVESLRPFIKQCSDLSDENKRLKELVEIHISEDSRNKSLISNLRNDLERMTSEMNNLISDVEQKKLTINDLEMQVNRQTDTINAKIRFSENLNAEIELLKSSLSEVTEQSVQNTVLFESEKVKNKSLLEENSALNSEIQIMKKNLLDKEDGITLVQELNHSLENDIQEMKKKCDDLSENLISMEKEKNKLLSDLHISKAHIDDVQNLYSDSMKLQNEYLNKFNVTVSQFEKVQNELSHLQTEHNSTKVHYSEELDKYKKEEIKLKNHLKALEETLNENSENLNQEKLEASDREYSLKSQIDVLHLDLDSLKKSLQRSEEDLEGEKNLRESERNNMMGKITQLTEQLSTIETLKIDLDQRLEVVETENIESKLRLEASKDEKEKLLEKIILLENNFKKQNEVFSKKCKELEQLQSAILDLGRENQSLQITKEKIALRQWIGDTEVIDCYNCHKPFSITLRKHHCRNCGQVFCQDCSSKSAVLAASRKPVRVCDLCHNEVQINRRNSSVDLSVVNLSLQ